MPDWLAIVKAYIDDLETRLSAARAGYLDNINNAELLNVSAARLGYIDLLADGTVGLAALETLVDDLETAVGAIEGATTLHNKLTAARAALLDQITAVRLAELDAANLPADIDTLNTKAGTNADAPGTTTIFSRLAQIVTTYLADGTVGLAAIEALVDDLESAVGAIEGATTLHNKLTAARAALLDQITAVRLAELDAANIPADIDTLLTRLTAARAGYLDNIAATAVGRAQMKATTIDLNQAAATYDLLTGTTQAVILESLNFKCPTGAAGGALTSISIQTDDATVQTIIDSVTGAVANLTSEAELSWTGSIYITVATKIRLTIAGGATGAGYVCNVVAKCRAVVAGGNLA